MALYTHSDCLNAVSVHREAVPWHSDPEKFQLIRLVEIQRFSLLRDNALIELSVELLSPDRDINVNRRAFRITVTQVARLFG
jgi:hypothetical protein